MHHIILEGADLDNLLDRLNTLAQTGNLRTLTVETRGNGMAYKVNEYSWTPTIGRVRPQG